MVSGGWDEGMADTIAGTYQPSSTNHGRGVYRRVEPQSDSRVLLYYWDDRDGEENRGWWFGPDVGGEEVWAHNVGAPGSAMPPVRGWVVLHSGAVDPGITVTKVEAPSKSSAAPAPASAEGGRCAAAGAGASSRSAAAPTPRVRGSVGVAAPSVATPSAAAPSARPRDAPPARPAPAPSLAGSRRPRVGGEQSDELRTWLEGLDDGAGAMLQYYDVLASEFDADLAQIAAAKVEGGETSGILGVVDPSFWQTVHVAKAGHKMLFARGIAKL